VKVTRSMIIGTRQNAMARVLRLAAGEGISDDKGIKRFDVAAAMFSPLIDSFGLEL
jgi:hypothetical protein